MHFIIYLFKGPGDAWILGYFGSGHGHGDQVDVYTPFLGGLGREPQRGAGRSPAKKILPFSRSLTPTVAQHKPLLTADESKCTKLKKEQMHKSNVAHHTPLSVLCFSPADDRYGTTTIAH